MSLTYTRAVEVEVGDPIVSSQWNTMAQAFNDRLLGGVGDPTYRMHWYAHSLMRGIRNPDASFLNWPPEDEWWRFYAHIDPDKTDASWPESEAGEPEGPNVANPMNGFVFGNASAGFASESGRIGYDPTASPATGIPLWVAGSPDHPPATLEEFWTIAKYQRGVVVPYNTLDLRYANAIEAARSHRAVQWSAGVFYHKSYGGWLPNPDLVGDGLCADGYNLDLDISFSALISGLPDLSYSTCPETAGSIRGIVRTDTHYLLVGWDNSLTALAYTEYLEGPYDSAAWPGRPQGEQLEQVMAEFAKEFRGATSQRDPAGYRVDLVGFPFEQFFRQQYPLAPSIAVDTGSSIDAAYPAFEWTASAVSGTAATEVGGSATSRMISNGFAWAGFYAVATGLQSPVTIHARSGGANVRSFMLTPGEPGHLYYFPDDGKAGPISFVLGSDLALDGGGDVTIECAELLAYRPGIADAYLVLRMSSTDGDTANLDGNGRQSTSAVEIGNNILRRGLIINNATDEITDQTDTANKVNRNPMYEAARRTIHDRMRMAERFLLTDYAVIGGKSVFWFDRYARGVSAEDFDVFRGIAPSSDEVASGDLVVGETYVVVTAAVSYNGTTYAAAATFEAVAGALEYTGTGAVKVYDGIRSEALRNGATNEWCMFLNSTVYKASDSSIWKPEAYGDILGWGHDRCGFLSNDWRNASATAKTAALNRHIAHGSKPVIRSENPTGWRYTDGTHGSLNNSLITDQNSPSCTDDCEGPINHYKSCRLYEPDYQIESVVMDGAQVKVTLTDRLRTVSGAPASIAKDRGTWGGGSDEFWNDDYRTDEGVVREYLWFLDGSGHCVQKVGDVAPDAISASGFESGDFYGSCFPRFYFTRLMRKVYEDDNDIMEESDTQPTCDEMLYGEFILRAACEGFVDNRSTLSFACIDPDNARLYDYTFENLAFEAFGGGHQYIEPDVTWLVGGSRQVEWDDDGSTNYTVQGRSVETDPWTDLQPNATSPFIDTTGYKFHRVTFWSGNQNRWAPFLPSSVRSDGPKGFGPMPNTNLYAQMFNNLVKAVNLLVRARIDIPVDLYSETVVATGGSKGVEPSLLQTALSADPDPCTDQYLYEGINAAAFDVIAGIPTSGDYDDGVVQVPNLDLASGFVYVQPSTFDEGIYIECGTGKWMIKADYQVGKVVLNPDDPAINALPETIQDLVKDSPGVLGIMESFREWTVRDDAGGTRPQCDGIDFPSSWEGPVTVTPKYTDISYIADLVRQCILYDGDPIVPDPAPVTAMYAHKTNPAAGKVYCVNVAASVRTFVPATGERLFVKVPFSS